jgi:hypothetical protein
MLKNTSKSRKKSETPFKAYYKVIAKACGCSRLYAQLVLEERPLGKYKGKAYTERDTPLTRKIRAKAKELEEFLNPEITHEVDNEVRDSKKSSSINKTVGSENINGSLATAIR